MSAYAVHARDLGAVRELTLARPDRLNALHDSLLHLLAERLDRAVHEGARAIVLRGEGDRAFSAGYDLNALPATSAAGPLPDAQLEATLRLVDELPIPVVALVNGHAFGGGLELAARCDVRIGVAGTKLGMPPAKLGIIYAPRGLARFLALLGPSGVRRLFFTGEAVTAEEAQRMGLLDEVAPDLREAERRALALAEKIAANAPLAIAGMRRTLRQLEDGMLGAVDLDEAARLRRDAFASEDAREGREAFLAKRPPVFRGT